MRTRTKVALALVLDLACVADAPADMNNPPTGGDDESTSPGDDDDDDDADSADGESTSPGTGEESTAGDDDSDPDDGGSFIVEQDGGPGNAIECDVFAQDCDVGEKCAPWVNDGGNAWNATRCVPLDANPAQVGDPCVAEGGGGTGYDDCDASAMCWNVDETGMGVCVGFCEGSPAAPVCSDTSTACSVSNDVLWLCLPTCDPLMQDCDSGAGEACYLNGNTLEFFCAPDYSGEGGAYGEPCDSMYINVCNSGLLCQPSNAVPDCPGTSGCCTPFCPVSEGDANCPGAAGGQDCLPIYDEGQAPPGLTDVGICAIPM
jgi:hypothetical protein